MLSTSSLLGYAQLALAAIKNRVSIARSRGGGGGGGGRAQKRRYVL